MTDKTVVKCVCHCKTFKEIKEYAQAHNIKTTDELVCNKICGRGCGLCYPYVEKVLRTGETAFRPGDIY